MANKASALTRTSAASVRDRRRRAFNSRTKHRAYGAKLDESVATSHGSARNVVARVDRLLRRTIELVQPRDINLVDYDPDDLATDDRVLGDLSQGIFICLTPFDGKDEGIDQVSGRADVHHRSQWRKVDNNEIETSTSMPEILFGCFGLTGLLANRVLATAVLRRALNAGKLVGRRVVVVGQPDELSRVSAPHLTSTYGANEIARVTLNPAGDSETLASNDSAALGRTISLARELSADEIVLALDWKNEERIKSARNKLRACPLPVLLLPDRTMTRIMSYSGQGQNPPLSLRLQRSPLSIGEQIEKRVIDTMLSLMAIVALSPLFLLAAIAIKLDSPGPVIFRQWRNGFNGRPFRILKFRTMSVMEDGSVIKQAERSDPRITRVGAFLRRTSVDELPQLLNVLLGHMSLVGPRPHAMAHDDIYSAQIAEYAFRHNVKPGLTGWAQVNGSRGETPRLQDMERRIKCDLWYINHRSMTLDVKILIRTCLLVARGDSAY